VGAPSLTVYWDERFREYDLGPEHPFSERSRALAARLLALQDGSESSGAIEWVRTVGAASRAELETFHRPEYLDFVERASGFDEPILLDMGDTPSFRGCFEAAGRIVEGAIRGIDRAWESSHPAFHPAGGLHHARPERASGFCIFNDVAVAVGRAVRAGRRVAYLDIDAHHGDGVMYGFYDSGRVLDIDFHQDGRTIFPGTGAASETGRGDGAGSKVNVPLPPASGDEALLPIFRRLVPPLLRSFRPDVIVLQHGVDGHIGDGLARLQYTPGAYAEIDRALLALARELADGRMLVTGGGGYRASAVSRVLARTGLLLAGGDPPPDDAALPEGWRTEYRETIGERAPSTWADTEVVEPSRWHAEDEERLIAELERGLGMRFPAVRSS
jgi:acetoin utilization protein AcuC